MINVRDLHKSHGQLKVLRGVTMSVAEGEVAVVVGPSGGGKSTLLRCLNGLEPFDAGEVQVGGRRLAPGPHHRGDQENLRQIRRTVGFVFQQFNLFPHLTALGNVIEAPVQVLGLSRGAAEDRAMRLLDRVGLKEKIHERPDRLSGGQQQRVAIARALAMEPRVILFDEPTSALDPRMTAEVLAVLVDLAKARQTMVVVTHAMSFARRAATTVHVFQDGVALESGPPEQIFENPRHAATAEFLREHDGESVQSGRTDR